MKRMLVRINPPIYTTIAEAMLLNPRARPGFGLELKEKSAY
jgi:hypothetical protein